MTTKLYIGNINYKAKEEELEILFSNYGKVLDVQIIVSKETFKSKGFGFIKMESKNEASSALNSLNASLWMERQIVVDMAREINKKSIISNRLYLP